MSSHTSCFRWIDEQSDSALALLKQWVETNTGTMNLSGLEKLLGMLHLEFQQIGDSITVHESRPYEVIDHQGVVQSFELGKNLCVSCRPHAPFRVLLAIHMDTVYPADSHFQLIRPLSENSLCGPGVADAKGGIAVMLLALRAFERYVSHTGQDRVGWDVIINSDEEIGSPGSGWLFDEYAQRNQLGLLFEPTLPSGNLVSSRKGSGNFSLVVRGRASHAGREFYEGRNAVIAAADAAVKLHDLSAQWPGMTLNVARIEGGGPSNIVPDLAIIRFNIRYEDSSHGEPIQGALNAIVDSIRLRDGIQAELFGEFSSPPKSLCPASEWMLEQIKDCGNDLGLHLQWAPTGGACDGNRLAAAGLPNIDSMGVRGGSIHSPEEFFLTDSLAERAKLTAAFLMRLAEGAIPPLFPRVDNV